MKLKIERMVQFKTKDFCIGDRLNIKLDGYGKYTATVQKITKDGVLFLFDDVIERFSINSNNTNKGGFDKSDLAKRLNDVLLPSFPKKLRKNIAYVTIPTYGQIFGHDDFYKNFEPDNDEQFELMKRRGNRVCDFEGEWCSWWLRNPTKKEVSSAYFADVGVNGLTGCGGASGSLGVRPLFLLVR